MASKDDFSGIDTYPVKYIKIGAKGISMTFGNIVDYHTASCYRHRSNGINEGDGDKIIRCQSWTCSKGNYIGKITSGNFHYQSGYYANAYAIRCCAYVEDVLSGETEGN